MTAGGDEEFELGADELDTLFHDGQAIDLGAAIADSLALGLDPYPRSPNAEEALRQAGVISEEEAGPFAALAALKGKLAARRLGGFAEHARPAPVGPGDRAIHARAW